MSNNRFYDNLDGFSDIKFENGKLYGRQHGGSYQEIPTQGADGTDGQDGADGADGVSTYVYRAFAADSSGTGFSLIDSPSLKYEALLVTHTEIMSPSLADFANCTWKKIVGDDGVNGTNGTNGHDCYTYVAWASGSLGTAFSMTPTANLPYRAELHTDHAITSPSLSDFSGVPFVNVGGGSSYTFSTPLSVDANNAVSIDLTNYATKSTNLAGYGITDGAKKDLSNLTAHTAIDTSTPVDYVICRHTESDGSWVRIWKSGWVEQGGQLANGTWQPVTVTLPVVYANLLYTVLMTIRGGEATTQHGDPAAQIVTAGSITVATNAAQFSNSFWYTCGQGNATSIAQYIVSL